VTLVGVGDGVPCLVVDSLTVSPDEVSLFVLDPRFCGKLHHFYYFLRSEWNVIIRHLNPGRSSP
jgi:hypothetical protein